MPLYNTDYLQLSLEHIISLTFISDPATGRRRNAVSHDAILDATYVMLEEIGFDKLSLEGVATRAGVGKATIYRWWPNKSALAMEALLRAVEPMPSIGDSGSARQDIEDHVTRLAQLFRGKSGRVVREMIALAQFDGDAMRIFNDNYLEPRRSALVEALRRGAQRGEFRDDLNLDLVFDLLYAPLLQRLLTGSADIDERQVNAQLKLVLGTIALEHSVTASSQD
ncbi:MULTISPECIES: TetR/AcrR family transcriptional regulator [unclassified Herbaspirillum]|uniref:TetR/AcrR family transcriptional regulator n=1 Tax=unclassified Herbaspirillum TaxID=2624150 RepID=UPI00114D737E|nr:MULTISPECIES: TetR/AcrR family transcriptional regulator [unclassified Herbaspirillum]MBB5393291.1 AcrR family transcriptional regulator [Herbaspirillum sp. SJZ102]TQK03960.1 TetR family transcriptional regulator [Herbaspirillum sp. SJZ130]TQK08692.1 TetR family transcriptional regulator [Herbaspirillum sp. SJZ106]TWC71963.1 TetR family transcriptional regulator [Herbaspirillum sp. SJZ099]